MLFLSRWLLRLAEVAPVKLTENDIPGAAYTVPTLKWWLLCRGVQASTLWKKGELLERYVAIVYLTSKCTI